MLKRLELQQQLETARAAADAHREGKAALETRSTQLDERRTALNVRLDAMNEASPETEQTEAEAEGDAIETDAAQLAADQAEFDAEQDRLDGEVAAIENEIAAIDARAREINTPNPTPHNNNVRKAGTTPMTQVSRSLFSSLEERSRFFQQQEVLDFIENVRALKSRGVTGGKVVIPVTVLDVIRPAIERESKLLKHVRLRKLSGDGRVPVLGDVPEAVWTEACGKINELDMSFAQVDLENNKVAGFIPVCNALLEDSAIDLGEEVMNVLAASIAKAIDKAILYGTGTKMPLGIVTRLAQTSDPSDSKCTVPWVDLHTSNVITIANTYTGTSLFSQLAIAAGTAESSNVSRPMFAAMNRTTWNWLKAQCVTFDAGGALRAELDGILPVVGAAIEIVDCVPNYNIVMGYGEKYPLGERKEVTIDYSEHVQWIEDHTVFRGRARYDGRPAVAKAFVVVGVNGTSPTTTAAFRPDYANTAMTQLTVTAAQGGSSGKTVLTVSGKANNSDVLCYRVGDYNLVVGSALDRDWNTLTSGSTAITAGVGQIITVAELDANSLVVGIGKATAEPKA